MLSKEVEAHGPVRLKGDLTEMTFEDAPDVLYVEEVAQLLRIGRNGAYELINSGLVRSVRLGRRIIVPKSELRAFIDGNRDVRKPNSEDVA